MDRTRREWRAQLQRSDGQLVEKSVKTYWSPNFEGIADEVARTAAAEAWWRSGKRYDFAPLSAHLVEA